VKYYSVENLHPEDKECDRSQAILPWSTEEISAFMSPFRIPKWNTPSVQINPTKKGLYDDFPFDLDGAFIVSQKGQRILENLCKTSFQFLPVQAVDKGGIKLDIEYSLMVVLKKVDCLDYNRALYCGQDGHWNLGGLVINPDNVSASPAVFRVQGYRTVLVVCERVKKELEKNLVTGLSFSEVCLSTDSTAPDPVPVPEDVITSYRTQWKLLPRFGDGGR